MPSDLFYMLLIGTSSEIRHFLIERGISPIEPRRAGIIIIIIIILRILFTYTYTKVTSQNHYWSY